MSPTRRKILVFSLEPWGAMWYSKHHYAAELAKTHGVYFISPPDKWRASDLFSLKLKLLPTLEGVTVVHYRNNLPLSAIPRFLERWMHRVTARKLAKLLGEDDAILWCFHPTALALQPALRNKSTRLIYHVVDPYQPFDTDSPCAKAADLVVAINPWFQKYYAGLNTRTILIPHGVRSVDRDRSPVAKKGQQWDPYVILAGGITHPINYRLLQSIAEQLPWLKLVLAGHLGPLTPERELEREALLALPNVVYVGVLHPDELRDLIGASVAGLIAYDFEPTRDIPDGPTRTTLKVITYLAQLRPVITTLNCYIPELDRIGVYKVQNVNEFVDRVREAMSGRLILDEDRVNSYLDRITYEKLIKRILDVLPPRREELA